MRLILYYRRLYDFGLTNNLFYVIAKVVELIFETVWIVF